MSLIFFQYAIFSVSIARNAKPLFNEVQTPNIQEPEEPINLDDNENTGGVNNRSAFPLNCDWVNTPKYSCYNCYTQLVCKSTGGKLKNCDRYCNNGQCSEMPSQACRNNFSGALSDINNV